jgi:hypothetical protein
LADFKSPKISSQSGLKGYKKKIFNNSSSQISEENFIEMKGRDPNAPQM